MHNLHIFLVLQLRPSPHLLLQVWVCLAVLSTNCWIRVTDRLLIFITRVLNSCQKQEKILILNSQTSTNEFDQLCRIQLAYAHQTGGEIAETYVNLEATEIDAGN